MSEPIPLREHFETLLAELDKRYAQRFQAQEEAIAKADRASEKRFEAVNEFRAALNDQTLRLLPRAEADQRFGSLSEKQDQLRQRMDKSEGSSGGLKAGWGYLVGGIGLAATIGGMLVLLNKPGGQVATVAPVPQVVFVPSPPAVMPTAPSK